jgi:hypothetical protein
MKTICNIKAPAFLSRGKSAQNDSAESLLSIQYWSSSIFEEIFEFKIANNDGN